MKVIQNALPPAPELPRELHSRKRDLMQIHKQYEKERGSPHAPQSFWAALKLYYPKDTKETIHTLTKWVSDMQKLESLRNIYKAREADEALIKTLDKDGDGTISFREFCELSKATGFPRNDLRVRFRDTDLGSTGELTTDQMREVLHELREEMIRSQTEAILKADAEGGGGF